MPNPPPFQRGRPVMPDFLPADIAGVFAAQGLALDPQTRQKLDKYDALLLKWQKAINLVGPTTLEDRAVRHFLDSAQLLTLLPR